MDGAAEAGRTGQRAGPGLGWAGLGPLLPQEVMKKPRSQLLDPAGRAQIRPGWRSPQGRAPTRSRRSGGPAPPRARPRPTPSRGPAPLRRARERRGQARSAPFSDSLPFRGRDTTWGEGGGRERN